MAAVTITVLFTDSVGSTELFSRVGEVRADELRREHFALLRAAVAEFAGREVKNLGDGLMVVFDGVTAALDGAVAMQQAITARHGSDEPLAIRVGVASGECDMEDGDYFGVPVVEAARLCAKAQGGEILVTSLVRLLARSRSTAVLEPVGVLELKGLDEPVETYRVRWTPPDPAAMRPPLPPRLVAARSANFVGRDDERARLAESWKAVVVGNRRLMLLAGEPGIGKTTLAAEFAADVYCQDGLVVYSRSDEDLGVPYQPWIAVLSELVAHTPVSVLAAHVADRNGHLARLVPSLAARLGVEAPMSADADAERFVLYGCVTDLLARVSAEQPVLIVFDDLHWADRATVQLLRHVACADQPIRVGVLGTFRDSEIGTDHPVSELLAAMHREGGTERIALRGFGDDELLALLETVAGHDMDEQGVALRDALLAETEGNPFFVAEILRHLAETGAIYQDTDGRWVADTDLRAVGLPVSVREVIGRRIATLGPDSERVLALASVIGRDFDIRLLTTIANVDEDTIIDLCDVAVAAAVLVTTDRPDWYSFAHTLIEHTLYDSLSPARRARAHNAIAETLENLLGDDPGERTEELAYHWAAAVQPTDTTKAIHYAQLAGDRALEQLAPDDALRWYTQALELLNRAAHPDDRQRARLLVGLGDSQRQCGIVAHRETLLEAAHLSDQVDDIDGIIRAVLANNRGYNSTTGDVDHERIAAIDRALARLGEASTAERAKLLALAATERIYEVDLPARLQLGEQGVAVAGASGDRAALAWALQRPLISLTHPSTLALRTGWANEARGIADALGDAALQYWTYMETFHLAVERGDRAQIDDMLKRAEDLATRVPHATIRWNIMYELAWVRGLDGDLAEFERRAETALALGMATGQPDASTIYSAQLGNCSFHQGRIHELIPVMEQALADTPTLRVYRAALALAHAHGGHIDEAKTIVDEELAAGFPLRDDIAWSTGMVTWAEAVALVGSVDAAGRLRERLLPYPGHVVTTNAGFSSAVAHGLGRLEHLLGNHDNAETWFSEALDIHQQVRSPVLIAESHSAWAELLADRNRGADRLHARTMAQTALDAAAAGGYGYVETDARAVLDRLG